MENIYHPISEVISQVTALIQENYREKGPDSLKTGFDFLDSYAGGLCPSSLYVLFGAPSVGKRALAQNILRAVSVQGKVAAAWIALDQSAISLALRLLTLESCVNSNKIRSGLLKKTDLSRLAEAADTIAQAPIELADQPWLTIDCLCTAIRDLVKEKGTRFIVIEPFDCILPAPASTNSLEDQARIARALKLLAIETKTTIMVILDTTRGESPEGLAGSPLGREAGPWSMWLSPAEGSSGGQSLCSLQWLSRWGEADTWKLRFNPGTLRFENHEGPACGEKETGEIPFDGIDSEREEMEDEYREQAMKEAQRAGNLEADFDPDIPPTAL